MAWLTYNEAAQKLAIAPASVRQRARRGRWSRRMGNDGLAKVDVPDAILSAATSAPTPSATSPATSAPTPPAMSSPTPLDVMRQRIADLEAELAARPVVQTVSQLEARVADLQSDRDAWRALALRPWWRRLVG